MLRTGKTQQYGARLRLSPKTSNRAARLRPAKASALTVSTAIFRPLHFAALHSAGSEKWPISLIKTNWSDTPPLGYTAVCRDFPFALSSHSLPFRSTGAESDLLACAGATAPFANAPIGYAAELA
jgi:hypothetical protein